MIRETISANDIQEILRRHFHADELTIEEVAVASLLNKVAPDKHVIGIGGVLDMTVRFDRKAKFVVTCTNCGSQQVKQWYTIDDDGIHFECENCGAVKVGFP